MTPTQLAHLETEAGYPEGIAARIDSTLLARLLAERMAALRACSAVVDDVERGTGVTTATAVKVREALAKARMP